MCWKRTSRGFRPHLQVHRTDLFCFLADCLNDALFFTEEKANLENKFPGKNGIGGLFQGKTPLRKPNPQQAIVTPLRPGKKEHLRKKLFGRMVEQCVMGLRDLGELCKCCILWFIIGEMGQFHFMVNVTLMMYYTFFFFF